MQHVIEITSPFFIHERQLSASFKPDDFFPCEQPLALEIGCGIGDFVVQMAHQRPDRNYLAIDIYNKGCLKTCRKIEAAGLENVRVMRLEARYLLVKFLPPECLSAVFVNCPDPWPKKRHRRRRLVNAEFLHQLLSRLKPGGEFSFCTDYHDYAEEVGRLLEDAAGWSNLLEIPFRTSLPARYPRSKYMRRFVDQGLPLHFLHYRREQQAPVDAGQLPAVSPGFRLTWSTAAND